MFLVYFIPYLVGEELEKHLGLLHLPALLRQHGLGGELEVGEELLPVQLQEIFVAEAPVLRPAPDEKDFFPALEGVRSFDELVFERESVPPQLCEGEQPHVADGFQVGAQVMRQGVTQGGVERSGVLES